MKAKVLHMDYDNLVNSFKIKEPEIPQTKTQTQVLKQKPITDFFPKGVKGDTSLSPRVYHSQTSTPPNKNILKENPRLTPKEKLGVIFGKVRIHTLLEVACVVTFHQP